MRRALLILLVLGVLGQLQAQQEPSAALEALSLVPAEALQVEHSGMVTYTDWLASFSSRGGGAQRLVGARCAGAAVRADLGLAAGSATGDHLRAAAG